MSLDQIFFIGYGVFLLIGAYFGWKAGSLVSLRMGLISGVLVLLSVGLSFKNAHLGFSLLTAISGLLTLVFIMRFIQTLHFMPSGILLLVSLAAFLLSIRPLMHK